MRATLSLLPLSALLSGCFGIDPLTGVWLFRVAASDDPTCETEITHNFLGAVVPTEEEWETPWTFEQVAAESDALLFGQIVRHGDGEVALVLEDRVFPGAGEGDEWTFSWTGVVQEQYFEEHDAGYNFVDDVEVTNEQTVTLALDGDAATGNLEISGQERSSWTESDMWDPTEVGLPNSQIPSASYLEDNSGASIFSVPDVTDCAAESCELSVSVLCDGATSFTATRTETPPEAYEGVQDAGQPVGVD
jgi:hypothetical protein